MAAGDDDVGVLTTDRDLVVRSWDAWLAAATGIPAGVALGHALAELFPEIEARGLVPRLRRVADEGAAQVLAPAFHHYLIPCPPRHPAPHFARMQQHVTLSPLRVDGEVAGVIVSIRDVTARRERERRTADALESADEATRLRAVEALAAAEASPDVLVGAFDDASWRVRQAAVEAVARVRGDGVTEVLTRVLRDQHRDLSVLNATLSALAASGEEVLPALLELLASPDADLRVYVALALGLRGDADAVPALVAALDDPDDNVRFHAMEALGRLRARDAVEVITDVATAGDFTMAFAALDALASIGDETAAPRILSLLDDALLGSAAADALGRLGGEEAVAPLAALLARDDIPVGDAAGALAAIHARYETGFGDGAVIAALTRATVSSEGGRRLLAALETATAAERPALVRVLGWLDVDGVDEALLAALADPAARPAAADGLVRRGSRGAAVLAAGLGALDEDAMRTDVQALGRIGSPVAIPALLDLLQSTPDAAGWVAAALGAIGDARAFEPLVQLLGHFRAAVRQAAVAALCSIGHPGLRERIDALLRSPDAPVRESAVRIAAYVGGEESVEALLSLCRDDDESVRRGAIEHLVGPGDPRVAETLASALAGGTGPERAAAARALARLASADADPLLTNAFEDADLWVRYYAARSCGSIRGETCTDALESLALRDPAVPVRIAALQALGDAGASNAVRTAIALAEDGEPEVRQAALGVLGTSDGPAAIPPLSAALGSDDTGEVRATLDALAPATADALAEEIAAAARDAHDPAAVEAAASALVRAGTPQAVHLLAGLAADPKLRERCVQALARLPMDRLALLGDVLSKGGEASREAVLSALAHSPAAGAERLAAGALEDPSPRVRRAAAQALERLDLRTAAAGVAHG